MSSTTDDLKHELIIAKLRAKIYKQMLEQKMGWKWDDSIDSSSEYGNSSIGDNLSINSSFQDRIDPLPECTLMEKLEISHSPKKKQKRSIEKKKSKNKNPISDLSSLEKKSFEGEPGLNTFTPDLKSFEPGLNTFEPGLNTFTPDLNTFEPDLNTFEPEPDLNAFEPELKSTTKSVKSTTKSPHKKSPSHKSIHVEPDNFDAEIQTYFVSLKDARNYSPILVQIKDVRTKMQSTSQLDVYIQKTQDQISCLKTIFIEEKKWSEHKILSIIPKFLTPLDSFITQTPGYEKQSIDLESIERFKLCVKLTASKYGGSTHTHTFESESLFGFITMPYLLALYSVQNLLTIFLTSRCKNIIHIGDIHNHDSYRFYKYNNESDKWIMDCRLEQITRDLACSVKTYCCTLFRDIYKQFMKSNTYDPQYRSKRIVFEYQCAQLLENFYLCVNIPMINSLVRECVKHYNTCSEDSLSNGCQFDFKFDDIEQKNYFETLVQSQSDFIDETKLLFDNISDEDALSFCNKYIHNKPFVIIL